MISNFRKTTINLNQNSPFALAAYTGMYAHIIWRMKKWYSTEINCIKIRKIPIKAANFVYFITVPVQALSSSLKVVFSDKLINMSVVLMLCTFGKEHTSELVVQLLMGNPIKIEHSKQKDIKVLFHKTYAYVQFYFISMYILLEKKVYENLDVIDLYNMWK